MPTIRFLRDVTVVTALPSGKNRKTKIPRGAIHEVEMSSARWRCDKGDAEMIAGAPTAANFLAARAAAPMPVVVPVATKLLAILSDVNAGDWEKVYSAFTMMDAADIGSIKGLSEDAVMILSEAVAEIQRDGALTAISSTDLVDALQEVQQAGTAAPVPPLAPVLPAVPAAPTRPAARQRRAASK